MGGKTQGGTLILSPHPDDAAFCVGGLLQTRRLPGPVTIATLFGRTNFFGVHGFVRSIEACTAARRAEDLAFAQRIGCSLVYFEQPEASLRFGPTEALIMDPEERRRVVVPASLAKRAQTLASELRPSCILAPMGLGGHRDHLVARQLAFRLEHKLGASAVLYEDLPYSARVPLSHVTNKARSRSPRRVPILVELGRLLDTKIDNAGLYASQTTHRSLGDLRRHALRLDRLRGAERLWAAPGWRL